MLDTARGLLAKQLAIAKGVGEDRMSGEIDAIFASAERSGAPQPPSPPA
jgi:hypothetical protein